MAEVACSSSPSAPCRVTQRQLIERSGSQGSVLIFTFGPVQGFIKEGRRTADLFVGSRILVKLVQAAAKKLKEYAHQNELVYPADISEDVPNVLVAVVPLEQAQAIAEEAEEALLARWRAFCRGAHERLSKGTLPPDDPWQAIWDRQVNDFWELSWAAAPMAGEGDGYATAYRKAIRAINGAKRLRPFVQKEEPGPKDTLSGRRAALHTASLEPKKYWAEVANSVGASKLRPDGRERLDAIGAVKRFCELSDENFPSTSSVATAGFLAKARPHLEPYRNAAKELLGRQLYLVSTDQDWPYDGDLLFKETLTPERLEDSYGLDKPNEKHLQKALEELQALYKKVDASISPYYALIALDGDSMGKHINSLLDQPNPLEAHRNFSRRLSQFSEQVKPLAKGMIEERLGGENPFSEKFVVYNGGDDVVALAPLEAALPLAARWADAFERTTEATASAGIAICHHLVPLDAVLEAAREAERAAKKVPGQNALCVRLLRRSGETTLARSRWRWEGSSVEQTLEQLVEGFQNDWLAMRLPGLLEEEARIVGQLEAQIWQSVLIRLVRRHLDKDKAPILAEALAGQLFTWAQNMSNFSLSNARKASPAAKDEEDDPEGGLLELARWLLIARFLAQGGAL